MRRTGVVLSIAIVFALLSISVAAVPVFVETETTPINSFELDPITQDVAIQTEVETIFEEKEAEPEIAESYSSSELSLTEKNYGANVEVDETSTTMTIKSYYGSPTKLQIGDEGSSAKNVVIAEGAFRNCKTLTTVDLGSFPTTKTLTIDFAAFYGCENLTTVTLPAGTVTFGGYAFYGTPWISTLRGEDSQKLAITNGVVIDGCSAKGDIVIPNTVTAIAPQAFAYNSKITSITMTTISEIPYRAFANCSNLESASLAYVKTISNSAFSKANKLTTIKDCDNLETIGELALNSCSSLTSFDTSALSNFKTVERNAFQYCTSLTEFTFPGSIRAIGIASFQGCTALKTVTFNESTNEIECQQGAFMGCKALDTMIIPTGTTVVFGAGAKLNTKLS